jgi:uncharacterized repeat protein (TIGR03803 family)
MDVHSTRVRLSVACLLVFALSPGAPAGELRVLHHFGEGDGEYPDTDLVMDAAGNLYGMTVVGGDFGSGTVFRLAKTPAGWAESVLYSFTSTTDGGQPYGGVTLDAQGSIYGTTVVGGSWAGCPEDGCGVVFRLQERGGTWVQDVIHAFDGGEADGYGPGGPVSFDAQGNLYGMTPTGGAFGLGVVFRLEPTPSGPWTETVIHHFTGGEDGAAASKARLLVDDDGSLLGVATAGGAYGAGTAFRLAPEPGGGWTFTTLYAFQGYPEGVFPYGGLVRDAAGNLYGTTYYGGQKGLGTVYQLSLADGAWYSAVLHHFRGGRDGAYPISALALGADGALYGTTSAGGVADGMVSDHGTIFRLAQDAGGAWEAKVVHAFDGADGELPYAGLLPDGAGSFFGAAVHGGADGDGTLFRFTP